MSETTPTENTSSPESETEHVEGAALSDAHLDAVTGGAMPFARLFGGK